MNSFAPCPVRQGSGGHPRPAFSSTTSRAPGFGFPAFRVGRPQGMRRGKAAALAAAMALTAASVLLPQRPPAESSFRSPFLSHQALFPVVAMQPTIAEIAPARRP